MIHFSTDCVFSGKKERPYTENDQSDAEDLYGRPLEADADTDAFIERALGNPAAGIVVP
jgi:dTDP-4-dehydrorhamnose reductase